MSYIKKLGLLILCFTIFVALFGNVYAFYDVTENYWAYEAINYMSKQGIINGYPDGSFRPNDKVTREEFAKILATSLPIVELDTKIEFADVSKDRWSKEFIDAASGYLTAYKEGDVFYFKPMDYALREDIFAASVCALNLQNSECDMDTLKMIKDRNDISPNLEKYIAIALQNNIVAGYPDGTIKPKGELTRAEVSKFMYNILIEFDRKDTEKVVISDLITKTKIVPSGQVIKFAKKLNNGQKFKITINDSVIEGFRWESGKLFELYPYYGNLKYTDQFLINESTNSWCTMFGAESAAKLYGFVLEKSEDKVKFKYVINDVLYYDESPIDKGHVKTDVLFNFICFVLNNDKTVSIKYLNEGIIEEKPDIEEVKEELIKVPSGQIAKFAKKLTPNKYFEINLPKTEIIFGKYHIKDKAFLLYLQSKETDNREWYDEHIIRFDDLEGNYYAGQNALTLADIFGFDISINDDYTEAKLTYTIGKNTYYDIAKVSPDKINGKVESIHIQSNIYDNFICFVLNNKSNLKIREWETVSTNSAVANLYGRIQNKKIDSIELDDKTFEVSLADNQTAYPNGVEIKDKNNKSCIVYTCQESQKWVTTISNEYNNFKSCVKFKYYRVAVNNYLVAFDVDGVRYVQKVEVKESTHELGRNSIVNRNDINNFVAFVLSMGKEKNQKEIQTISLPSNLSISLAKQYQFKPSIVPSDADVESLTWSSSNEKVAIVNSEGLVKPVAVGNAIIKVVTSNGKASTCALKVYALKYDSTILNVGETVCIVHGADRLHDFKSSNVEVAIVDSKGNVTAKKAGIANITALDANNTEIKCVITVKGENTSLEKISFDISPKKNEYKDTETLTASVKTGTLQGSEVIIWEFEIDGKQIATNSGKSMKVSKILEIGALRYKDEIYGKEITLKLFPRDVRDNSDREITEFKFKIIK